MENKTYTLDTHARNKTLWALAQAENYLSPVHINSSMGLYDAYKTFKVKKNLTLAQLDKDAFKKECVRKEKALRKALKDALAQATAKKEILAYTKRLAVISEKFTAVFDKLALEAE